MIACLRGKLIEANFTYALIDVNGVGYQVFIPVSTFDSLPKPGGEITLQTIMVVREDAITLFGFATAQEKQLFEILVSVNGVGPKLALSILSCMPVSSFCAAIVNGDLTVINKINGVGKRTAERLVVELKDKLGKLYGGLETVSGGKPLDNSLKLAVEDATLALEQLGFKRDGIQKTMKQLVDELEPAECSTENLIRKSLQLLNS
jgi:Holliday junction DNA helicase RuvA